MPGYPNGFEMQVLVQPGARPYNPDGLKTAQLMRSDLAKIRGEAQDSAAGLAGHRDPARQGTI